MQTTSLARGRAGQQRVLYRAEQEEAVISAALIWSPSILTSAKTLAYLLMSTVQNDKLLKNQFAAQPINFHS